MLIDSPYDNKMLVNTMQEIMTDIEEWSFDLAGKFEDKEKQTEEIAS